MGVKGRTATVALIGNPNCGKSTLFNRLTGNRQRVGNFPGVTVAKTMGRMALGQRDVTVLDLPGAYSLAAYSPDERIVSDVLGGRQGGRPDLVVCLLDARHLARGLFLAMQIGDLGVPMVLAVNFLDELEAEGLTVDTGLLIERLGVPVVCISARKERGLDALRTAMAEALEQPAHVRLPPWPPGVQEAVGALRDLLPTNRQLDDAELRRVLFDDESALLDIVGLPKAQRAGVLREARERLVRGGADPMSLESTAFHQHSAAVLDGVVRRSADPRPGATRRIDAVLTHRVFGLAIFAALMFLVFQSIYTLATPLMDGIEGFFGWLGGLVAEPLAGMPVFRSLVCDGVLAGVGGVVVFLPQIFLLFLAISILEDSGYMARAAFLMDRLFGWCGLTGKSFLPLLSSYSCAVPGILATRTIENPCARLVTVLIAPLMSCSARLPVYLLVIGAFVEPEWGPSVAALTLFGMHVVGLVVALPAAWFLNRWILRTPVQTFVFELPPYRWPAARDVLWRMWSGGREFLERAGSIILAMSIVIWALLYFPHHPGSEDSAGSQAAQVEQSYLGQAGKAVQPVFAPAGFDWKITVGVLASFPAREVIISTLGVIYRLGGDADEESLAEAMRSERWPDGPLEGKPVFTLPTALALMVFFAFCMQCVSTLAVMGREVGTRYAVWAFFVMTALAWVAAVAVYQIGSRIV